jgi:hypothetical protein
MLCSRLERVCQMLGAERPHQIGTAEVKVLLASCQRQIIAHARKSCGEGWVGWRDKRFLSQMLNAHRLADNARAHDTCIFVEVHSQKHKNYFGHASMTVA